MRKLKARSLVHNTTYCLHSLRSHQETQSVHTRSHDLDRLNAALGRTKIHYCILFFQYFAQRAENGEDAVFGKEGLRSTHSQNASSVPCYKIGVNCKNLPSLLFMDGEQKSCCNNEVSPRTGPRIGGKKRCQEKTQFIPFSPSSCTFALSYSPFVRTRLRLADLCHTRACPPGRAHQGCAHQGRALGRHSRVGQMLEKQSRLAPQAHRLVIKIRHCKPAHSWQRVRDLVTASTLRPRYKKKTKKKNKKKRKKKKKKAVLNPRSLLFFSLFPRH